MEDNETRVITEPYNPSNPLHWAKWQAAGRPSGNWSPEVTQTLVEGEWVTELPSAVVTTWAQYDPGNADHVRRAALNKIADPVGTDWSPTLTYHLKDGAYVLQAAPEPEPPSILEIFGAAVEAAKAAILQLKAAAWTAQVAAGVSQADATANGVVFAAHHAVAIANYELAGGHPIAAAALLSAIQADVTHTWLQLPGVMAVFESALAPPA